MEFEIQLFYLDLKRLIWDKSLKINYYFETTKYFGYKTAVKMIWKIPDITWFSIKIADMTLGGTFGAPPS